MQITAQLLISNGDTLSLLLALLLPDPVPSTKDAAMLATSRLRLQFYY